jgi:hypothetical protein
VDARRPGLNPDDLKESPMDRLSPESPHGVGVAEAVPGSGGIEGAHLLADEARDCLRKSGFTDGQIDAWAEAYVAGEHSGDVDTLLAWIAEQEHCQGSFPAV